MIKLSDSELEIMHIIWEKEKITSTEIIQLFSNKKLNANTIRTFITKLLNKNAITVLEKNGKSNYYIPVIEKEKYCYKMTKQFINIVYKGSREKFLMDLIRNNKKNLNDARIFLEKYF